MQPAGTGRGAHAGSSDQDRCAHGRVLGHPVDLADLLVEDPHRNQGRSILTRPVTSHDARVEAGPSSTCRRSGTRPSPSWPAMSRPSARSRPTAGAQRVLGHGSGHAVRELVVIREPGYASNLGEGEIGIAAVAVVRRTASGPEPAALAVSVPEGRVSPKRVVELADVLHTVAERDGRGDREPLTSPDAGRARLRSWRRPARVALPGAPAPAPGRRRPAAPRTASPCRRR